MYFKKRIGRRKFIELLFLGLIGIYFPISNKYKNSKVKNTLDKKKLMKINLFNIKREEDLKNNLPKEIKKDLIANRTVWIGRKLLTYAELKI